MIFPALPVPNASGLMIVSVQLPAMSKSWSQCPISLRTMSPRVRKPTSRPSRTTGTRSTSLLLISDATSAIGCSGATHSTCRVIASRTVALVAVAPARAWRRRGRREAPAVAGDAASPRARSACRRRARPRPRRAGAPSPVRTSSRAASVSGVSGRWSSRPLGHHVAHGELLGKLVLREHRQRDERLGARRAEQRVDDSAASAAAARTRRRPADTARRDAAARRPSRRCARTARSLVAELAADRLSARRRARRAARRRASVR